ncbi:MAG: LysR substrate-binding domain-containing protein [Verrucomicrobiota bacterium]
MEFHQLRYFVAAAEELSITRAAERVHISQPALSRQIAALEDELSVALFDRIRKRIHLTEAGRFFLPRARQILCDIETTAQQTREQFGSASTTIRIGFLTPFLDDIVAPAMKELRRESPRTRIALFELSPRAQLDRLRGGELDLAVLGNLDEEDRARFATRPLMRARMAAVIPVDHPLAHRKQIVLKELSNDPFVSLSDEAFPGRRHFLQNICQSQGFDPDIVDECDSLSLLLGSVSAGVGVALLPHHSQKLPHAGCVFINLKTPAVYVDVFAVFRNKSAMALHTTLLEHLLAAADKVG